MSKALFGVGLGLGLLFAACGGSAPPASPPPSNTATAAPAAAPSPTAPSNVVAKIGELDAALCKCVDRPCVDRVTDDMTRWGQEISRREDSNTKMTEADAKQIAAITEHMTRCMTKILTEAAGSGAGAGQ